MATVAVATLVAACSGGGKPLLEEATDVTEPSDDPTVDCEREVDGPGLSRAGIPGPIVFQEPNGAGLVVVRPDGKEQGRIEAPAVTEGIAVGARKALYATEADGLLLVDAAAMKATALPGPVTEIDRSNPYVSGGGTRFLPLTNFAGGNAVIVELEATTATDLADITGGGTILGVHLDDAEQRVAVFTRHGAWITHTTFLADETQLDPAASGRGDISADGCAVAYFRAGTETGEAGELDVVVAEIDAGRPGETVATVPTARFGLPAIWWVGPRLVVCDDDGAFLVDPADGSSDPIGVGRCEKVVRNLHRSEALVEVGTTVDPTWFHVGAKGPAQEANELQGHSATTVTATDLVPFVRDVGEPYLVYSFLDHTTTPTEALPAAQSSSQSDMAPGIVVLTTSQSDGTARTALAIDLRDGTVHVLAAGAVGVPEPAPDGSAAVVATGTDTPTLSIVPIGGGGDVAIGNGTHPVWTIGGGGGGGGKP